MLISSNPDPARLRQFRKWIEAEWGHVDPFEGTGNGIALPAPILAIADDKLIGGLSFTHSAIPETQNIAVWINALLVSPGSRGMGIGSKLVLEAERIAAIAGIGELYVYTDIPRLYEKLGWAVRGAAADSRILRKDFTHDQRKVGSSGKVQLP